MHAAAEAPKENGEFQDMPLLNLADLFVIEVKRKQAFSVKRSGKTFSGEKAQKIFFYVAGKLCSNLQFVAQTTINKEMNELNKKPYVNIFG